MTTDQTGSSSEHWMIRAAVDAAPPLSSDTIDRLRLVLAKQEPPASVGKARTRKTAQPGRRAA